VPETIQNATMVNGNGGYEDLVSEVYAEISQAQSNACSFVCNDGLYKR
jgi:hypothetical protein